MTVPVFGQVVHARVMRARGYWRDKAFHKYEVAADLPRAPLGKVQKCKLRSMFAVAVRA